MEPNEQGKNDLSIKWLPEFEPAVSPVYVRNEMQMAAPAEKIWDCLTHASKWPEWYPNSSNVQIIDSGSGYLNAGSKFKWKTFGVSLISEVVEFVPGERIAWTGKGIGVWVCHAWLIHANNRGTYVLTEETQHGFVSRAGSLLFPNRMHKGHDQWLHLMEKRAQSL